VAQVAVDAVHQAQVQTPGASSIEVTGIDISALIDPYLLVFFWTPFNDHTIVRYRRPPGGGSSNQELTKLGDFSGFTGKFSLWGRGGNQGDPLDPLNDRILMAMTSVGGWINYGILALENVYDKGAIVEAEATSIPPEIELTMPAKGAVNDLLVDCGIASNFTAGPFTTLTPNAGQTANYAWKDPNAPERDQFYSSYKQGGGADGKMGWTAANDYYWNQFGIHFRADAWRPTQGVTLKLKTQRGITLKED
jgi:hypothetical protein